MRLPRRPARVDHHHAPGSRAAIARYPSCTRPKNARVSCSNRFSSRVPRRRLRSRACSVAAPGSRWPPLRIQQDRQIRLQIPAQHPMQLPHRLAPQPPPASLISLGRIREPVAQHDRCPQPAPAQSLPQYAAPAKQTSAPSPPAAKVPPSPNRAAPCGSSPPSSVPPGSRVSTTLCPAARSDRRQLPHLRALARSVEPFKRDELSAPRHAAKS